MASTYADVQAANMALQPRGSLAAQDSTVLTIWDPDLPETSAEGFLVLIGPDDVDLPGQKKFFRGITLHGTGTARVLFFTLLKPGQADLVKEATALMTDEASQLNTVWMPRGTKGYYCMVLLCINGRLDECQLLWDPIGAEEG